MALTGRLSAVLPPDVVVRQARRCEPDFDARFSAIWRRYTYRIADTAAARDPLRRDVLWHRRLLDVTAMTHAAAGLRGEHDFASFCKPRPGATTVRELQHLHWERTPDGLVRAHARADAFCHSMVRALVGACLAVGEGRREPRWPAEVLAARERSPAVTVAPARGLTLEEVGYPPAGQYASRATMSRRVRTLPAADPR